MFNFVMNTLTRKVERVFCEMSDSYIEENIWMFQNTYIGGGQDNQEYFGGWTNQGNQLKNDRLGDLRFGLELLGPKMAKKPWNGPKTL